MHMLKISNFILIFSLCFSANGFQVIGKRYASTLFNDIHKVCEVACTHAATVAFRKAQRQCENHPVTPEHGECYPKEAFLGCVGTYILDFNCN